jgi:transmembrane sensor
MELSEQDWQRLEQYLTRQGTADELARLDRWVEGDPKLKALADGMRTAELPLGAQAQAWDTDAAWRKVARRMRWFSRPPVAPVRRASGWLLWAVAASLALIAGSSLSYFIASRGGPAVAPGEARQVVTRRGERAAFNLADGSRVVLGAESRLAIPAGYGRPGAAREVNLEGQGYFEVTHDSLRPFRVITALGTAQDLGTEFVVSTYAEARGMRVVVASGKVGLRQPASGQRTPADSLPLVTLTAGDLAQLDSLGTATVRRVDPVPYVQWTSGTLAFNGTPLHEVIPQLARWYDVDIRLADSTLGSRRFTASFHNQSASQALALLALSLDLTVDRTGRAVVLRPSSHPRP